MTTVLGLKLMTSAVLGAVLTLILEGLFEDASPRRQWPNFFFKSLLGAACTVFFAGSFMAVWGS